LKSSKQLSINSKKNHYPDTDFTVAAEALRSLAPSLLRIARLASRPGLISVKRPGTDIFDVVSQRTNGYAQGLACSSAIAGVTVSLLASRVRTRLLTYYTQNKLPLPSEIPLPTLSVAACHDNIILHVHRDAAGTAIKYLNEEASRLKYRLDDWVIQLHGNSDARNETESELHTLFPNELMFLRNTDSPHGRLLRPDLTDDYTDIPLVMGVPIFEEADHTAVSKLLQQQLDSYTDFANNVLHLYEQTRLLRHGEHSHFAPVKSALQLAFGAVRSSGQFYQHYLKAAYSRHSAPVFDPFIEEFDSLVKDVVFKLLRLDTTAQEFPHMTTRFESILSRSQRTGGAGVTLLRDTCIAATLGARSGTAALVARACGYTSFENTAFAWHIHRLVEDARSLLKVAKDEQDQAHREHKEDAEADRVAPVPAPHCAVLFEDLTEKLDTLLDNLQNNDSLSSPPDSAEDSDRPRRLILKLPQKYITQQLWRAQAMKEYYNSPVDSAYFPTDWSDKIIHVPAHFDDTCYGG